MEPEEFIGKVIMLLTVVAAVMYVHYNLSELATEKVIDLTENASMGFRVSDDIRKAQVYVEDESDVIECKLSAGETVWRCSDQDWNYVGASPQKLDGKVRKCTWAHPVTNKTLIIRFDNENFNAPLRGYYGIIDGISVDKPGIVTLAVLVDGVKVFDGFTYTPGLKSIDIGPTKGRTIEFQVFTDRGLRRHFCFDVWSESA